MSDKRCEPSARAYAIMVRGDGDTQLADLLDRMADEVERLREALADAKEEYNNEDEESRVCSS